MTRVYPAPINPRRHTDSPILWVTVLAGSLLLNALSALSFQEFVQQMEPRQAQFEPIAIDFLAANPQLSTKSLSTKSLSTKSLSTKSSAPTAAAIAPQSKTTSATATSRPSAPVQAPSSRASYPSASPRSSKSPPPTTATPSPPPPLDSNMTQSNVSTTSPQAASPETAPRPANNSEPITSNTLLPSVPTVPDPSKGTSDDNSSMRPLPISRNPIPSVFLAQVKVLPLPDDRQAELSAADLDSNPLTRSETSKTLSIKSSDCLLTPETLHAFNQPVVLDVPLDKEVLAQPPTKVRSSGNDRYDELAICALKSGRFDPGTFKSSAPQTASSLRIQVTLVKPGNSNQ